MSKLQPFSWSRLEGYENCPKKFFLISIDKSVVDPPNEHTQYGTDMHLAFANYVKKGTMVPLHLRQHLPMLNLIKNCAGEKVVEQQIAIDTNYKQTGWFDKDVYCRVISDVTIMNGPKAVMFDYKSGKEKSGFDQLRLAAAVMFCIAEELEEITMHYVWTKTKRVTSDKLTRDEMPGVWANLHPRLMAYQNAFVSNTFEARPGFGCKYCPVKACPYNEKR